MCTLMVFHVSVLWGRLSTKLCDLTLPPMAPNNPSWDRGKRYTCKAIKKERKERRKKITWITCRKATGKKLEASLFLPSHTQIRALYIPMMVLSHPSPLTHPCCELLSICIRPRCAPRRVGVKYFSALQASIQIVTPFLSCGSSRYSVGSIQFMSVKSISNSFWY